jgi:hypothetical protein
VIPLLAVLFPFLLLPLLLGGSALHGLLLMGLVAIVAGAVRLSPALSPGGRLLPRRRRLRPFAALLCVGAAGIVAVIVSVVATSVPRGSGSAVPATGRGADRATGSPGSPIPSADPSATPDQVTPDASTPTPDPTPQHHGHHGGGADGDGG